MRVLEAWQIDHLEQLRREQSGQSDQIPIQLPLPEPPRRQREDKPEEPEEPARGVVVIDYSVE